MNTPTNERYEEKWSSMVKIELEIPDGSSCQSCSELRVGYDGRGKKAGKCNLFNVYLYEDTDGIFVKFVKCQDCKNLLNRPATISKIGENKKKSAKKEMKNLGKFASEGSVQKALERLRLF